jgi:hypothetical protein
MKCRALALAVCVAALAACEARNPVPALESAQPEPDMTIEETALDEIEGAAPMNFQGMEMFDGDTTISVIDTGPQDDLTGLSPPKFALHCDTADKTLEVVAPARQLGVYAVEGPAALVVSGVSFPGEAVLTEAEGAAINMALPLTPELLEAIATTVTARVVIGDGFAESNADTSGAFPGFAGQCSLESGIPLPPR